MSSQMSIQILGIPDFGIPITILSKIVLFSENVLQKIQTYDLPKTSYHSDMKYAWV